MSDVIPAQVQQLPGREWTYDNNPNAFEAVLGGLASYMNSQAEMVKEQEKRRSTEMGQAFAAMVAKGLVDTGKNPTTGETFSYGGSPFHYTQPGDPLRAGKSAGAAELNAAKTAKTQSETYKIQQQSGLQPMNEDAAFQAMIKSQMSGPGFAVAAMQDPVKAGQAAVQSTYAMIDEMNNQKQSRTGSAATGGTKTSSGKPTVGGGDDTVRVQGKDSKGVMRILSYKKSDKKGIQLALSHGGTII